MDGMVLRFYLSLVERSTTQSPLVKTNEADYKINFKKYFKLLKFTIKEPVQLFVGALGPSLARTYIFYI